MNIEVIFTANAGLLIRSKTSSILIDSLFTANNNSEFSAPDETQIKAMLKGNYPFENLSAMLFTHLHADHGEVSLLYQIEDKKLPIVMPFTEMLKEQLIEIDNPLSLLNYNERKITTVNIDSFEITSIPTVHDGGEPYHIEHFSYLIKVDDKTILVLGDAYNSDELLLSTCKNETIHLACLNFVEVAREEGRKLITDFICPNALCLYHLPTPNDDSFSYIEMTKKNVERYKKILPTTIVIEKENTSIEL